MRNTIAFYPISSINKCPPYLYTLNIAGTKLMCSQGFPLDDLLYLTINQKCNKKVKSENLVSNPYIVTEQQQVFLFNTARFDLQFLQYIDFSDIAVFLISQMKDLLLLHYLLRIKTFKAQIICTQATYQLGAQYVRELHQNVLNRNNEFQNTIQEDYFQEQDSFQHFEDFYNVNYQEFAEIFTFQPDFECTIANYGQIVKIPLVNLEEVLEIEIQPSGVEIGGSVFILRLGSYFKLTLAPQLNLSRQICKSVPLNKLGSCDYIILGMQQQNKPAQFNEFMKYTQETLSMGRNVMIPFMDHNIILGLQDMFNEQIQHKCHKIFVISSSFMNFLHLANTNVEYLELELQNNIMNDNPQNPFIKIMSLIKTQKLIIAATLEEIKFDSHTLQSTIDTASPSVYFIYDTTFRIGQSIQLMNLLESKGTTQMNIYTQNKQQVDYSFALILIEQLFFDNRLLLQLQNKYKYILHKTPLDGLSGVQYIQQQIPQVGMFVISESIETTQTQSNQIIYKMLQRIDLTINQVILQLATKEEGSSNRTLCNLELSKVRMQLELKNNQQQIHIYRKPHWVKYRIGGISDTLIGLINDDILQQHYGLMLQNQQDNELIYINQQSEIVLIVQVSDQQCKIFGIDGRMIQNVDTIVNRVLGIKTL